MVVPHPGCKSRSGNINKEGLIWSILDQGKGGTSYRDFNEGPKARMLIFTFLILSLSLSLCVCDLILPAS